MRADFVNEVAKILDIKRKDMIEKDMILHQILFDLSDDRFFAANVLFKGGTCLIKSYFGYLRFSEEFEKIAEKRGMDFKCEKSNAEYIEFGGGNKTCTFKMWYISSKERRTERIAHRRV